jgi:hypothetical protein
VAFDIEQPACFYLGREYDLGKREVLPDKYVMYDARDLTTHGVVVGMTGSGKTGLCIALLEEAALDGIPSVIIDPKGDLTNLLLHFPDLDPKQFAQWLNEEDAQQKGLSKEKYAEELAQRWRKGLEDTGQSPDRIRKLKESAEWRIYTPGSETGLPLSILGSFAAPKGKAPREALTQKIDATATALLGLTGIASDPVQSREHILIAQLLLNSWTAGKDLDLAGLIRQIQNPPIRTVGAYNLETFFPAKERLKFASTLNNVLAAPSFSTWTTGEPLDLSAMLFRNGKPQQLIFYIAHLDDTQRMFFTTLLLEELLSWTRKQSGTSNLRALLYFDEVFGYLPPHPANPPSKGPLLTLLKQGLPRHRHLVARQPRLRPAQHPQVGAGAVSEPVGTVVPARPADARPGVGADATLEGADAGRGAGDPAVSVVPDGVGRDDAGEVSEVWAQPAG